jgi:hypothetical protein
LTLILLNQQKEVKEKGTKGGRILGIALIFLKSYSVQMNDETPKTNTNEPSQPKVEVASRFKPINYDRRMPKNKRFEIERLGNEKLTREEYEFVNEIESQLDHIALTLGLYSMDKRVPPDDIGLEERYYHLVIDFTESPNSRDEYYKIGNLEGTGEGYGHIVLGINTIRSAMKKVKDEYDFSGVVRLIKTLAHEMHHARVNKQFPKVDERLARDYITPEVSKEGYYNQRLEVAARLFSDQYIEYLIKHPRKIKSKYLRDAFRNYEITRSFDILFGRTR